MQRIAARLRLRSDHTGDCLAKLRVVILAGDLGLGHRIQIGIYNDNAENRILIVSPVQLISRSGKLLTVDEDLLAPLRILRAGMRPRHFRGSGTQQKEVREISVEDRQLLD